MALSLLTTSVTPLLRPTKASGAAPALSPSLLSPSSSSPSPATSCASVNHSAGCLDTRYHSPSNTPQAPFVHATRRSTDHLQNEPSPAIGSARTSCTMGLFSGARNAVKRISSKRGGDSKERNKQNKNGTYVQEPIGDGSSGNGEPRSDSETGKPIFASQPHADPIASRQQIKLDSEPLEEPKEELQRLLNKFPGHQSDSPSASLPERTSTPEALKSQQRRSLRVNTQLSPMLELPSESAWGSDLRRSHDADEELGLLEVITALHDGSESAMSPTDDKSPSLEQFHCELSDGDRPAQPYRFPFQGGRASEDQQSFNTGADRASSFHSGLEKAHSFRSGLDKAACFRASSYRGQGRVDSHAMPNMEDSLYGSSVKAEIVRLPQEDLTKPTLRAEKAELLPEQPQYYGIDELASAEDDVPLFSPFPRKLSDEPVSPTAQPPAMDGKRPIKYCPPTAESVADSDLADSDAHVLHEDTEPDASEASSDAESLVSELVPNREHHPRRQLRQSSMPAVSTYHNRRESIGSFNTLRSAEWMSGAPPSSFYPHPEEPDPPASQNRHLASEPLQRHCRAASYSPFYDYYSPAKQRVNARPKFNSRLFPSTEEVERRVAQAREDKRQKELLKREQEQRAKEASQREREKEIYHARITNLEYEKRQLSRENGQISLKNDELQKRFTKMASRYTEQRRKLTELEMQQRAQEDYAALLKNNPHGLVTPPDTASSRSTPVNPERVRAWAETLADPALLTPEPFRAHEALQEREAMQEHGDRSRGLGQAANNALREPSDPTSTRSSPVHPAHPAQSQLETLPEMSVEYMVQPDVYHPVHKHPRTRFPERKAPTPIYSKRDGTLRTAASFGSEQLPLQRNEAELENEQPDADAKPSDGTEEGQNDPMSRRASPSFPTPSRQLRQPSKQVQFEAKNEDTNRPKESTNNTPRRYRDVLKMYMKQQSQPVSKYASPPVSPQPKQPILRNKPSIQQMPNPLAVNSPNVPTVNSPWHGQLQNQANYPASNQVFQRQQLGNYENQMAPMMQPQQKPLSRQHSAPQLAQPVQQLHYAHQHAQSSPQVQTLTRPGRGLAAYAKNSPHPEASRKPSLQTLNPPRPSTSNSQYRPTPTNALRPSTSHGSRLPSSSNHVLPPRPGTSHSTRGGQYNNSSLPPPLPTIPQGYHTPFRSSPNLPMTPSAYIYPQPPPAPMTSHHQYQQHHTPGSNRSHDTSASHRTQLSKMQNRAYKGLAQNERANAERTAKGKADGSAADAEHRAHRDREEAERLRREAPQARARDLVAEGAMRGRMKEELLEKERRKREAAKEKTEFEERVKKEVDGQVKARLRVEGWTP